MEFYVHGLDKDKVNFVPGEMYGGRKVLKDLGLSEIFSPQRVLLDSVQLNLANVTHVTSIHMTKVKVL